MENIVHNGLKINFYKGWRKPEFDDNVLSLYTDFTDWTQYQKVDLCLDEKIVKVSVMSKNGEPNYSNIYLVYDFNVWNRRGYKDMSVIKNLERVGEKMLPRKDKHNVHLEFGRSKLGKIALEELSEKIKSQFEVLDGDELVRFRNWDQTKDIIFKQNVTKASLEAGQDVLEEFVRFLDVEGYPDEATSLNGELLKALFEKVDITLDFKDNFTKKKKS